MATRGGQELPSIAFTRPGAMEYVAADWIVAVPRTCNAASPSLFSLFRQFFSPSSRIRMPHVYRSSHSRMSRFAQILIITKNLGMMSAEGR